MNSKTITLLVNQSAVQLPAGATLADLIARQQPQPPFAAAVNLQFVPKTHYAQTALQADDRIDLIAPVTGG